MSTLTDREELVIILSTLVELQKGSSNPAIFVPVIKYVRRKLFTAIKRNVVARHAILETANSSRSTSPSEEMYADNVSTPTPERG